MTGVNTDISDIFFNLDHVEAETHAKEGFVGYDPEKLAVEAESFLDALTRLGIEHVPSVEDLCNDFRGRV